MFQIFRLDTHLFCLPTGIRCAGRGGAFTQGNLPAHLCSHRAAHVHYIESKQQSWREQESETRHVSRDVFSVAHRLDCVVWEDDAGTVLFTRYAITLLLTWLIFHSLWIVYWKFLTTFHLDVMVTLCFRSRELPRNYLPFQFQVLVMCYSGLHSILLTMYEATCYILSSRQNNRFFVNSNFGLSKWNFIEYFTIFHIDHLNLWWMPWWMILFLPIYYVAAAAVQDGKFL